MKIFRSTLLVAATAMFAAACGDKVTVAPPATATANVNSVQVAPNTATLAIGGGINLTAAVSADPNVTYTVAWTSSDATKASVSATGGVLAIAATPGVAICAKATATNNSAASSCASIVVTAAATTSPATVSIASITGAGGLNNPVPVPPGTVAGQMDVRLNVTTGTVALDSVTVFVNGKNAGTQRLNAAQAASLRSASDAAAASADQTSIPTVVISVNTAAYNATTGVPTWLNGTANVSAVAYGKQGGVPTSSTASNLVSLLFGNANAFVATTTAGGTTATANNAAGFRYTKGDLTVSLLPISYSGVAFASGQVSFGTAACDGGVGAIGTRSKVLAASGSSWAATIANSGAAAAGNMSNYSFNSTAVLCTFNSTGEMFQVTAAQDANGNPFTTTALPFAVGTGFRMDNQAPVAPALNMTVGRRANAWVNDAVLFNATAANGGVIAAAVADGGAVGSGVGTSTTEANEYSTTVGGVVITTAASLAESNLNSSYSATAKAQDLLGNTSAASAAATFGVDRTAPTMTYGGPADQAVIAAPGGVLAGAITYLDPATLPAGPSTPSATPVRNTIVRRTTATASTTWNNTSVAFNSTGSAFSGGLAGVNVDPGATNTQAYYVVTLFVEDGAGNPSASITRSYLYDITAPTGPFAIPVMTTSAGASNLFTSSMTDNLDLASSVWFMNYNVLGSTAPGAAGAGIATVPASVGSFLSFTTTASDAANYPLYRSMTDAPAGTPVFADQGSLLTVTHTTTDRAGLAGVAGPTAVPAANLPTLAVADPYAAAQFAGAGFVVSNAAVTVDISGNGVTPVVNSLNLTATATGVVNVMPVPFTRVDFFIYTAATNTYHLIGTATTGSVVDNATNRVYTYTVNWVPGAVGGYTNPNAAGVQNIIAIGSNATFDGVRTANNANVTTQP